MKQHRIEIACDTDGANDFCEWLIEQGHDADVGTSTGNYVDGRWCNDDGDADQIMHDLWGKYCQS
jgi:hypothetical protein